MKTKFFGIGHVQIEVSKYFVIGDDIIIFTLTMLRVRSACFDSVVSGEVDVVYANSAICRTLARGSYPGPRVTIRFRLLHQLR